MSNNEANATEQESTESVSLILNRHSYRITCRKGEAESLLEVANQINEKIENLRKVAPGFSDEKLALLTALDICHDLYKKDLKEKAFHNIFESRMKKLKELISNEL